jgi:uncharacterized protein
VTVAGYDGPTVDIDVHHMPKDWSEVEAYLPERWRGYRPVSPPFPLLGTTFNHGNMRGNAYPEDGPPGSDYQMTCEQLLDPARTYRCVLTHNIGQFPLHTNQYFMRDVCRAANDWNVDTWLSHDDERLHSAIVVPSGLPEEVPHEVKRLADHPKLSAILIAANPLGRPLGDPLYHPVFEAGEEHGLPITVHVDPAPVLTSIQRVGGESTNRIQWASQIALNAHQYISSMLVHGVFEKYPSTRVLLKEFGIAWLPWLMWRLDDQYDRLREESPWVKKWPSEYIREHIKLATQPVEEGQRVGDVAELLMMVEGIEDLLCYSSDYPHATMDDFSYVARVLPNEWHEKVFCRNACDTYRWEVPIPAGVG